MKYKSLIIFLYFGYTLKTKYRNLVILLFFFLTSGNSKTSEALDFGISHLGEILLMKKMLIRTLSRQSDYFLN
jgi:hypothetical protein